MNIMKKRFIKSGKSIYQIAKEMKVEPKKVQEVIDNKRELTGDHFNDFIKATEKKTSNEKVIERKNMISWLKEQGGIKKLRCEFGYTAQEMSKEFKVAIGTWFEIESGRYNLMSLKCLDAIYDFFKDDINKKVIETKEETQEQEKISKVPSQVKEIDKDRLEMANRLNDIGLKELRLQRGYKTLKSLCLASGIPFGTYHDMESGKHPLYNCKRLEELYNFYFGNEDKEQATQQATQLEENTTNDTGIVDGEIKPAPIDEPVEEPVEEIKSQPVEDIPDVPKEEVNSFNLPIDSTETHTSEFESILEMSALKLLNAPIENIKLELARANVIVKQVNAYIDLIKTKK